jgi:hypothetical protein
MKNLLIIAFLLIPLSAFAEQPTIGNSTPTPIKSPAAPIARNTEIPAPDPQAAENQQQEPARPCSRSKQVVKTPGFDLDEVKCLLAVTDQSIAQKDQLINKLTAALQMVNNDLADVQKSLAEANKKITDLTKK